MLGQHQPRESFLFLHGGRRGESLTLRFSALRASLPNLPCPLCPLHSHPNDDKDSGFFPRNPSSSSMNSVLGNHHPTPSHGPDGAVPTMADDVGEPAPLWPHDPDAKEVSRLAWTWAGGLRALWGTSPMVPFLAGEGKKQGPGPGVGGHSPRLEQGMGGPATASGQGPSPIPVLRPQKPLHMPGGDGHRGKSLKLLEKIPEDAEATVVLVGEEAGVLGVCSSTVLCSASALARWPGPQCVPTLPDLLSRPQLALSQSSACFPSSFLLSRTAASP